jgi:hypothetical protein
MPAEIEFANSRSFVQLMVLLRELGIVGWSKDDPRPAIKDAEALDAFGFATFLATLFEAHWRRRGLFAFLPYGARRVVFLAAEPTGRGRFVVGADTHFVSATYTGGAPPRSHACPRLAYYGFNWSVIRQDPLPAPHGCAGGAACADGCATEAWFRKNEIDGAAASACLGGVGIDLATPPEPLQFLYSELPPELEDTLLDSSAGVGLGVRNLKLYGFDAYATIKIAARLGATRYTPNTTLTKPMETAELDGAAFREHDRRLAILETSAGTPEDLDRLKTKFLQWMGVGQIEENLRYVYATAGTFAFPHDPAWSGVFHAIADHNRERFRLVELGKRFPVIEEIASGTFDPAHLRAAFDRYVDEIVTSASD